MVGKIYSLTAVKVNLWNRSARRLVREKFGVSSRPPAACDALDPGGGYPPLGDPGTGGDARLSRAGSRNRCLPTHNVCRYASKLWISCCERTWPKRGIMLRPETTISPTRSSFAGIPLCGKNCFLKTPCKLRPFLSRDE